ncbi:MAG: hypothetical protein QOH88_1777 [Verrucomicrobiota bacterium]|jgi:hypothetical protein
MRSTRSIKLATDWRAEVRPPQETRNHKRPPGNFRNQTRHRIPWRGERRRIWTLQIYYEAY